MLDRIKLRIQDMKTVSELITGADKHANNLGEEEPGAEHFILSALGLPDGSAQRVLARLGANSDQFSQAIRQQYKDALSAIGIEGEAVDIGPESVKSEKLLQNSKPSGQALMKQLYAIKKTDKDNPLLGAHVLMVAAKIEHGVTARAFKVLGINRQDLLKAANEEIESI